MQAAEVYKFSFKRKFFSPLLKFSDLFKDFSANTSLGLNMKECLK